MSANLTDALGTDNTLPENQSTAFFLALVFKRLGGSFTIGSNGQRYCGRPLGAFYRLKGEAFPQLPDAKPHERFHSEAEWQGALKLVDTLISRLAESDKQFIFDVLAPIAVDERKFIPSIEEPKRRAA